MDELDLKVSGIVGDSLISAAAVSYYGAFTSKYRANLMEGWAKQCKIKGLPLSQVSHRSIKSRFIFHEQSEYFHTIDNVLNQCLRNIPGVIPSSMLRAQLLYYLLCFYVMIRSNINVNCSCPIF